LNKIKRSRDNDWIPANKDKIKLFFGILLLQGTVQKPKMGDYFSQNRLLAMPTFLGSISEKRLLFF
jgi:hypothetical protein